jgi:ABC-2 type transport system ATP-binding protein
MTMNEVLRVSGLCKRYPGFQLENVSFSLEPGQIHGLVGRNGAGKSTTLKALLHMVHPDSGEIRFWGQDMDTHQREIKERIGFVTGGVSYYPKKKLREITAVTRQFYPKWDQNAYEKYCQQFQLDEGKTPSQLSAGMQVKYALALALSHGAELLLLDEPTSGLDPVSREELLEIFLDLAEQGVTILFSTHITSDLEKCAHRILYIQRGKLWCDLALEELLGRYQLAKGSANLAERAKQAGLVGMRPERGGFSGLWPAECAPLTGLSYSPATLEEIMVHLEKEAEE